MLKSKLAIALFATLLAILVVGAIVRTQDRLDRWAGASDAPLGQEIDHGRGPESGGEGVSGASLGQGQGHGQGAGRGQVRGGSETTRSP